MSTIQELRDRKSVRKFTNHPISKETKNLLIEAALQAPTAGNQNLYSILDITDPAIKGQLAVYCDNQPFIQEAPLIYVFVADHQRWNQIYLSADCNPRPCGPADAWLAQADACIAAQNMVVAAHSLGLGSCYIGDIIENGEKVKELLKLPDKVIPACMLVLGYPDETQLKREKPARFDEKYIVFENTYHELSLEEAKAAYCERVEKMGVPLVDYQAQVQRFFNFKYMSDFCEEMNRSWQFYMKKFLK